MKKNIILLSLLCIVSLTSCEKDEKDERLPDSSFSAVKNDGEWISTSRWANYSLSDKKIVITGTKKDPNYYQDERLHLGFKFADISQENTVTNFSAEWNFVVGGDAVADTYYMDPSYPNVIEISALDAVNKQIKGTFSIKLIRDKQRSDKGETFLFKNGEFNLHYNEVE